MLLRSARFWSRALHKWIGLVIGLQVLIWLATGLYMVIVDLDFIHGDPLVRNMSLPIAVPDPSSVTLSSLLSRYPGATRIGLRPVAGKTFYTVTTPQNRFLIEPKTGQVKSPLDEKTARDIAIFHFNGNAPISKASLLTSDPPKEIGRRALPLWRIDFDDHFNTSFYINPHTGALVTRRHQYWRIFDFFWMLHIMDYRERANANNLLLVAAEIISLMFTVTGLWMLLYSFGRRNRTRQRDA